MQQSFRQSMTWLHTWSGLVFCWIMYFIFITGTLGYFDTEIDQWMTPEIKFNQSHNLTNEVNIAENWLLKNASSANQWFISPTNKRENIYLAVSADIPSDKKNKKKSERINRRLDTETDEVLSEPRETAGGQVLYQMHYILHYIPRDIAYRFVGIVTLLMFIGLITGIIIHKKIFIDFFTFRPNKSQRSWLDFHNLLSVASLPFQLMITYSGLIFMLTAWMPLIGIVSYGADEVKLTAAFQELKGDINIERSGEPATAKPLSAIVNTAAKHIDLSNVRHIKVKHPGDTNATVTITLNNNGINHFRENIIFNAANGTLLRHNQTETVPAATVSGAFIGLHEGLFAGIGLRWFYFLSGLLGSGMIATGAIYWVIKRQSKINASPKHMGYKLVSAFNIGTIVGLPAAIGAYFLANRLLPITMHARADWEVHLMFIVWLIALIHPLFRSVQKAWLEQLWATVFIFTMVPVTNAITTNRGLIASFINNDWVFFSFDLTVIVFAIVAIVSAYSLKRRWHNISK